MFENYCTICFPPDAVFSWLRWNVLFTFIPLSLNARIYSYTPFGKVFPAALPFFKCMCIWIASHAFCVWLRLFYSSLTYCEVFNKALLRFLLQPQHWIREIHKCVSVQANFCRASSRINTWRDDLTKDIWLENSVKNKLHQLALIFLTSVNVCFKTQTLLHFVPFLQEN